MQVKLQKTRGLVAVWKQIEIPDLRTQKYDIHTPLLPLPRMHLPWNLQQWDNYWVLEFMAFINDKIRVILINLVHLSSLWQEIYQIAQKTGFLTAIPGESFFIQCNFQAVYLHDNSENPLRVLLRILMRNCYPLSRRFANVSQYETLCVIISQFCILPNVIYASWLAWGPYC